MVSNSEEARNFIITTSEMGDKKEVSQREEWKETVKKSHSRVRASLKDWFQILSLQRCSVLIGSDCGVIYAPACC